MKAVFAEFLDRNRMVSPWPAKCPDLPEDDHGWFSSADEFVLDRVIDMLAGVDRVYNIVEVGAWLGRSTKYLAKAGLVWSVDTWLGSPEHKDPARDDCRDRLPRLYEQWMANVWGYSSLLLPVRMTSSDASNLTWPELDLVFIDGDHSEAEVYRDIVAWASHVRPGGIVCGHDWKLPSVMAATQAACGMFERDNRLFGTGWAGNVWWMQFN